MMTENEFKDRLQKPSLWLYKQSGEKADLSESELSGVDEYATLKPCTDFDPARMTKCFLCDNPPIDTNCFGFPVCVEHMSGGKKEWSLSKTITELREQLAISTDLGEKRWRALNEIYEQADKRSANWCKRKAAEGLSIEVK